MAKSRVDVPKAVRERVLSEFHHRCSICGADRPQLHHIDENPGNNEPQNLLPLCPNHHLTDQHNPTAPVAPEKLGLFRRYKDPVILSSQFHPLYLRLLHLLALEAEPDLDHVRVSNIELIAFVNALKMGGFYHARIADLVTDSPQAWLLTDPEHLWQAKRREQDAAHRKKLLDNRTEVIDLVIEMLRYQDWQPPVQLTGRR